MAAQSTIVDNLYFGAATAITIFLFFTFLIHRGVKSEKSRILRKNVIRCLCIGFIPAASLAEILPLRILHQTALPDHAFAAAIVTLAWLLILLRKDLLLVEVGGFALITFLLSIAMTATSALSTKGKSHPDGLLILHAVRLFWVSIVLVDCAVRFWNPPQAIKLEDETTPLLSDEEASSTAEQAEDRSSEATLANPDDDWDLWGLDEGDGGDDDDDSDAGGDPTKKLRKRENWLSYVDDMKILAPYLIPKRDFMVQASLALCIICLIIERALNVLVPIQFAKLTEKVFAGQTPYLDLGLYLVLTLLHADSGLGFVKRLALIPVQQFSYRQLSNAAFGHVMSLSLDFHTDRDSAEVMRAVEQGGALTRILEMAFIEALPTVFDMGVAMFLLRVKFSSSLSLFMLVMSFSYMTLELVTSSWNLDNRRRYTGASRAESQIMHQAVQGWPTVSAFNMFSFERGRYGKAIDKYLKAKKAYTIKDAVIDVFLQGFIPTTFVILACLVLRQIQLGTAKPGDFVFLMQYWEYLIWPITALTRECRWLISEVVDAERMLDLLSTKSSIVDKEGAPVLEDVKGEVTFDKVEFSYKGKRPAVQSVSFTAKPGETIAFVGESGGGKSSLTKLLMRYYDVEGGSIRIDGHDVRDVTQGSLRDNIGFVPQDPLLFNTTIMNNLKYAKLDATEEEVYEACRAAAIHDRIMTFPDGYKTKVGESGMKLSGGEVQRLAIARVFLNNPKIMILDEATSAIDTAMEHEIQIALDALSRKRTTFIVAHRLSTIIGADQILVMREGKIVERGSHKELLDMDGVYANLWNKQLAGFSGKTSPDDSNDDEDDDVNEE